MAGYVGNIPVPQATQTRQSFTATASQTSFPTIGYTAGFIDVYLNGIKILDGVDYAATNGSDVVLTTGAALNDILEVTIFDTFTTAGTSFTNPTFIDTATVSGDTTATVTIKNNTEEDTDGGRESTVIFQGEQSGGEISTLAEIEASHDGTADDEKGDLIFRTNDGSDGTSPTERLRIDSDGNIGVNINAPSSMLHLFDGGTDTGITLQSKVQANATSSITFMSRKADNSNVNAVLKNIDGRLQSSAGIMFGSDTAAANALDDYEEGTCTLSWSGTGTQGPDNANFKYVKVGSLVSINGSTGATLPNPTGTIGLTGLPFVANGNSAGAILFRNISAPSNQIQLVAYVGSTQSEVQPYWSGSVNYTRLSKTDFNSSVADMYFSLNYRTT